MAEIKKAKGSHGHLYDSMTMFLRMECGVAKDEETGTEYELTTNIGGGSPIIRNKKTGRAWSIGWQELIDMAVEAGINIPDRKKKK